MQLKKSTKVWMFPCITWVIMKKTSGNQPYLKETNLWYLANKPLIWEKLIKMKMIRQRVKLRMKKAMEISISVSRVRGNLPCMRSYVRGKLIGKFGLLRHIL